MSFLSLGDGVLITQLCQLFGSTLFICCSTILRALVWAKLICASLFVMGRTERILLTMLLSGYRRVTTSNPIVLRGPIPLVQSDPCTSGSGHWQRFGFITQLSRGRSAYGERSIRTSPSVATTCWNRYPSSVHLFRRMGLNPGTRLQNQFDADTQPILRCFVRHSLRASSMDMVYLPKSLILAYNSPYVKWCSPVSAFRPLEKIRDGYGYHKYSYLCVPRESRV